MSEQKKIIVTGCTGQDGSYMVDYLLANTPHLVYGMVRRTSKPDFSNLTGALNNPRFQFVTGDLSDGISIDTLVRQIRPDYFINLGAQSFVKASWDVAESTFDINATGVLRCLEAIRKHVPYCRFYQAGSSEEYGKVEYSPQDENHPLRSQSPYGASKTASRQLVRVYRESYGLYAIAGYLFNHESPRRGQEFVTRKITLGVARIAKAIKDGVSFEPIQLGNLDAKRDWSHAQDFIDGIWKMLNQEKSNEYVLASGETHTIREFVEKAFAVAGFEGDWVGSGQDERYDLYESKVTADTKKYIEFEMGKYEGVVVINPAFYRPAEVDLLLGDSTRARTELGWQPKISFDELVRMMVEADLKAAGINI